MTPGLRGIRPREARPADAGPIRRVARTSWDHTYRDTVPKGVRREFLRRAYSDESLLRRMAGGVFLVTARDDEVLGFADFGPDAGGTVELAAIYVLPEAQGRGLGSRLLAAGMARFPAGTGFVLRVERHNQAARRFYEARGFRAVRELPDAFPGHEFRDVEMALEPGP